MSFFISLALYLFFTMYIDKNKTITKLIIMYTSIGIAVLTKGGAGFIIPIIYLYISCKQEKKIETIELTED